MLLAPPRFQYIILISAIRPAENYSLHDFSSLVFRGAMLSQAAFTSGGSRSFLYLAAIRPTKPSLAADFYDDRRFLFHYRLDAIAFCCFRYALKTGADVAYKAPHFPRCFPLFRCDVDSFASSQHDDGRTIAFQQYRHERVPSHVARKRDGLAALDVSPPRNFIFLSLGTRPFL